MDWAIWGPISSARQHGANNSPRGQCSRSDHRRSLRRSPWARSWLAAKDGVEFRFVDCARRGWSKGRHMPLCRPLLEGVGCLGRSRTRVFTHQGRDPLCGYLITVNCTYPTLYCCFL
ncbi:hypothetical protein VTI28DRAFT_5787 [Corynascus sepedonium]